MRPEFPVLIKARALIAVPEKWGKGQRRIDRPIETCCAAEAIEEAERAGDRRMAAYHAIQRAAGIRKGVSIPILDWNDAPERTHADVLAAFDKAIASAS